MNFVLKMMKLCIKNDEFCIKNDEICIKNDEFCIKNDEIWVPQCSDPGRWGPLLFYYKIRITQLKIRIPQLKIRIPPLKTDRSATVCRAARRVGCSRETSRIHHFKWKSIILNENPSLWIQNSSISIPRTALLDQPGGHRAARCVAS